MMTYREALCAAIVGSFRALAMKNTWRDIGNGLLGILVQIVRLLIIISLPFTVWVVAFLIQMDERKTAEQREKIRKMLIQGIHKNGRVVK